MIRVAVSFVQLQVGFLRISVVSAAGKMETRSVIVMADDKRRIANKIARPVVAASRCQRRNWKLNRLAGNALMGWRNGTGDFHRYSASGRARQTPRRCNAQACNQRCQEPNRCWFLTPFHESLFTNHRRRRAATANIAAPTAGIMKLVGSGTVIVPVWPSKFRAVSPTIWAIRAPRDGWPDAATP